MSFLPVAMEHRSIGSFSGKADHLRQVYCIPMMWIIRQQEYWASKIITEEPFEEISDNKYKNAENMIDRCQIVVDAGVHIGSCNHRMRNLLQYAQEKGKLKRDYL